MVRAGFSLVCSTATLASGIRHKYMPPLSATKARSPSLLSRRHDGCGSRRHLTPTHPRGSHRDWRDFLPFQVSSGDRLKPYFCFASAEHHNPSSSKFQSASKDGTVQWGESGRLKASSLATYGFRLSSEGAATVVGQGAISSRGGLGELVFPEAKKMTKIPQNGQVRNT